MPESLFYPFPSIEQFSSIIKYINNKKTGLLPKITFHGTVKLHGTNAAIGVNRDNTVWVQSRKNVITPESDNAGFAKYIYENEELYRTLLEKVRSKFNFKADKVIIFGEWCGANIQKGVALSQLPKMFVIFAIKIDERWLNYDEFRSYHSHKHQLYNIQEFPSWDLEIDFGFPQLIQNNLKDLTEKVERCCPVGKQLGIEGIGEGIVWVNNDTDMGRLCFKVKGKEHSVTHVKTLASVDVEKLESEKDFVDYAATENRFRQGISEIFGLDDPNNKKLGDFVRWVVSDVFKEESDTIKANNLKTKDISSKIALKAKEWFIANY